MTITQPLRALASTRALYEVPRDDLAGELLIPAMSVASNVRIMAGYFSSRSFIQLAPGLASFLNNSNSPLELLLSPKISDDDRDAIQRAVCDPETVVRDAARHLFEDARASESAIAAHVLDCLAYLVARDRLSLRFVIMERGIFHPKVWLFDADGDTLAVHGSSNATEPGLLYNGEAVSVDRPWADGDAAQTRVANFGEMFSEYWNNKRAHAIAVDPPAGLLLAGDHDHSHVPTTADFWTAWYEDAKKGLAPPLPEGISRPLWVTDIAAPQQLQIPVDLVWDSGAYAHQGRAVRAWEDHQRRGILAIATGGGKTISSFVAAARLQDEDDRPLLLVVLAPTAPLIDQWAVETRRFGVTPIVLSDIAAASRIAELHGTVTGLRNGFARTEVLICSNQLYVGSEPLRHFLRALPTAIRVMLIADEVHNLGTASYLRDPPETIAYRIGLSATPIRQYDTAGTAGLEAFFGPVVFEFDLGEAIEAGCLTRYHYHLHEVALNPDEMDLWERLTERLSKLSFVQDDHGQTGGLDDRIQRLLEKRRALLEHAEAKNSVLQTLLRLTPPSAVARTLIYTSAKSDPLGRGRQITAVNRLLAELGVISHQLTYNETGAGDQARRILADFAADTYQVLTAMKVLDEGLDVPATTTAYLLASSTVRREWVQRRGRVLRRAPGKTFAHLHDFLVVPPDPSSKDGRAILRAELARADEFCRLADNEWDSGGPRAVVEKYE